MYRNHIELMGFVGADPELRLSSNGRPFTRVTIATTDTWKDRDGNRQERTQWHTVFFWGKTAELATKLIKKGTHLFVEGALRSSQEAAEGGPPRERWAITGEDFQLLDRRERAARPEGVTLGAREADPPADALPF
jgi:single-strand DNA-binding protein